MTATGASSVGSGYRRQVLDLGECFLEPVYGMVVPSPRQCQRSRFRQKETGLII